MMIADDAAERDREWQALLDHWCPPHKPADWVGPAVWALLELAAAEPVLRGLFPWTSMNVLHVSRSDDFRTNGTEPFPAVAASTTYGFSVMTHPWGPDHVVLETTDPVIALEHMVRLTRETLATDPAEHA
ncbi:DUF6193 family natural product biosynthesis protein [Kitasatospora sp. NPDC051170]|uniref:DUF6193 family natural product biosynthesis protein n=1 Tax=Kitasatospora sp. NPDC051170 TaxID=3364056 RepID=UPI00379AA2E8